MWFLLRRVSFAAINMHCHNALELHVGLDAYKSDITEAQVDKTVYCVKKNSLSQALRIQIGGVSGAHYLTSLGEA
mgnify:CR=1 FL=1